MKSKLIGNNIAFYSRYELAHNTFCHEMKSTEPLPPAQQQDPLPGTVEAQTVLIRQAHADKQPKVGVFPDDNKSKNH